MFHRFSMVVVGLLIAAAAGCTSRPTEEPATAQFDKLSQYGLFIGNGASQEPAAGVLPYDLTTPLFSDYTEKLRFVKLPPGTATTYHEENVFEFPVGTVIAKTFAYPVDARDPAQGRRLLETRILKHEVDGWVGIPYIWNDEQTEATREVAGDTFDVRWIDEHGLEQTNNYIVPNANQCKGCHKQDDDVLPIGPKARYLNKDYVYHGGLENQLAHWSSAGALQGAPAPDAAPRTAVWDDPHSGTLDERARAWLEINCAHCHNPSGPARNAGLDLRLAQQEPRKFGIFKTPVAAGRGSGGFTFDIVPGHPDESILIFRMLSTDTGIMMPELGKRMIHKEGVDLVREWIAAMPTEPAPTQ